MRVKLLTFRYSATLGGFDDTPLADFTRDKEVIAQREHFYMVNDTPHITLVITYQDAIVPRAAIEAARAIPARPPNAAPPARFDRNQQRDGAPDPAAGLDENERALFNHLREWRSKQAHEEGLPAYLLLTNKQFVAIVRKRPESLNALGHIDGVGPGKLERYGAAILACVHGARPAVVRTAATSVPASASTPTPGEPDAAITVSPTIDRNALGTTPTLSPAEVAGAPHAEPPGEDALTSAMAMATTSALGATSAPLEPALAGTSA